MVRVEGVCDVQVKCKVLGRYVCMYSGRLDVRRVSGGKPRLSYSLAAHITIWVNFKG